MALIGSSHLNNKNGLIPLAGKLDEDNYSTWKKSVLLVLRTLKLEHHLSHDKIPPQFEVVSVKDAASDPNGKKSSDEAAAKGAEKQDRSSGSTILQESGRFLE
ncbi:hypothetical protein PIB30_006014 [Stylosanthes scabra]|uniref:Retrotransposon Copia-like N-terminal domain-containing protein n=1 Tax=Stylosanthes scabra TaxID=79078 RepID=A0ABU6U2V8_9FABA|nr:hypothetical protein [Stylosanthes scabra]